MGNEQIENERIMQENAFKAFGFIGSESRRNFIVTIFVIMLSAIAILFYFIIKLHFSNLNCEKDKANEIRNLAVQIEKASHKCDSLNFEIKNLKLKIKKRKI